MKTVALVFDELVGEIEPARRPRGVIPDLEHAFSPLFTQNLPES